MEIEYYYNYYRGSCKPLTSDELELCMRMSPFHHFNNVIIVCEPRVDFSSSSCE